MPKHYCDYCDVFLTHDSASVRKAHNSGRNHLQNVRDYYASLGHDKAQSIIDQITQAYESGQGPPPGGFGFTASDLGGPSGAPVYPIPAGLGGPPGFPPFPPGGAPPFPPGGMMGGPPPFPPNGFPGGPPPFPPNGPMPPFPPNAGPPGAPMAMPPFPPNGGPPGNFSGPPANDQPPPPGAGPTVHPDRLRMMNG
ncbi:U1 zinc finger-domain-containing protein [Flagelloscypha sp. PMI_526]|nr:U1 zinc finger-domain-containing protein [Flagelloscypha sp. PMI_526]